MQLRLLASLLVLGGATAVHAETLQCTAISSVPVTLSTPGSYCLTGDLVSTAVGQSAVAITIASDNVQLDLNGHSLVGSGGSTGGYGIFARGQRSLRVRNGTLRGFTIGVAITDSTLPTNPLVYSGTSARHEVSELHVEGAYTGISVFGHYSSVHHNVVTDSSNYGISVQSVSGSPNPGGALHVHANQVFNTGAAGATSPVFGISVSGPGSVIQDNIVANLRGAANSAAIYTAGANTVVSGNRETDYGNANGVYCANAAKVEGNIGFGGTSGILNGCISPSGYANNNF